MSLLPRTMALVCLLVSAVIGFIVAGAWLVPGMIGMDPTAFPAGEALQSFGEIFLPNIAITVSGLILAFGSIIVAGIATFFLLRSSVRAQAPAEADGRRSFLAGAAGAVGATVVGGGAMMGRAMLGIGNEGRGWLGPLTGIFNEDQIVKTHPDWKSAWKESRVEAYGRLGRTEWEVSDIVMGTGKLEPGKGEWIVQAAIDRGINYLDTAPDYSGSGSEQIIGRALQGRRDKIFLATKFCTPKGHLPADASVEDYKLVIEESLRRLNTDHVDLIHVHSCDEIDRLMSPTMHEAFDRLKQEGKARFLGFSSHTPNLVQVADEAIASGRFDVMMLAYHFGIWPQIGETIKRARKEQDMGVVAMKTLKGAKHRGLLDFAPYADSYAQAALKWARGNPDVSCAVISMFEPQHVDEYLYSSGKTLNEDDIAILREYDHQVEGEYCSPHCGDCLDSCPAGVPIADVMRHRMYYEDYGTQKDAMHHYAALARDASICVGCSAPCAGACTHGLNIQERTVAAHEMLSFDTSPS